MSTRRREDAAALTPSSRCPPRIAKPGGDCSSAHVLFENATPAWAILDDPAYRETLRQHAIERKLPPAIETLLWHYGVGLPRQIVEVDAPAMPIFTIARLPDLTPMPAQLSAAIDVQPRRRRDAALTPASACARFRIAKPEAVVPIAVFSGHLA